MADVTDTVRVLLVDDDALVRMALGTLFAGAPDIEVVGEAEDGADALDLARRTDPDVVLMDVRMPRLDGIEATRRLAALDRPPATIMLTTFESDTNVLDAVRAGAVGFLLKHAPPDEIVGAVRSAGAGEPVFGPSAVRALMTHAGSGPADAGPVDAGPTALDDLSPRERDIAVRVARGLTNAEIAAELFLSAGTVKAVISTVLARTDLQNRTQLAIAAHRELGPEAGSI